MPEPVHLGSVINVQSMFVYFHMLEKSVKIEWHRKMMTVDPLWISWHQSLPVYKHTHSHKNTYTLCIHQRETTHPSAVFQKKKKKQSRLCVTASVGYCFTMFCARVWEKVWWGRILPHNVLRVGTILGIHGNLSPTSWIFDCHTCPHWHM